MRWNIEPRFEPWHMMQRTIRKFALLPIKTEDGEVRWLEWVMIQQTYYIDPFGHWVNDCFVDEW